MKSYPFICLLFLLCIASCAEPRQRKSQVVAAPGELITGCYYVNEDSIGIKKTVLENGILNTYYLNPQAIITVNDFETVALDHELGLAIQIHLNKAGTKAFADASKKSLNKRLGFVIAGQLVMAPVVSGEISGGEIQISGNFEERELENLIGRIETDMYEN